MESADVVSATDENAAMDEEPWPQMRIDWLQRGLLFVVSYAPLSLMLALRSLPESWEWGGRPAWGAWVFGLLGAGGLLLGAAIVRGSQRKSGVRRHFATVRDEGGAVGGYLATYLLPLLAVTPANIGDWLAYGLYGVVAFVVFVRTDLALVNPTLYLFGWRVVSAAPANGSEAVVVICKRPEHLRADEGIRVVTLAGCFVTKGE